MNTKMMQLYITNWLIAFGAIMFVIMVNFENPYLQFIANGIFIAAMAIMFGNTAVAMYKLEKIEEEKVKPKGKKTYGR